MDRLGIAHDRAACHAGHLQVVRRRRGAERRRLRAARRRDPWAGRRERRRQIDPDEDHRRPACAVSGQHDDRRARGAFPLRPRRARRGHRHGAPGAERRARPHGRRERLSRQAADPRRHGRLAGHVRRRARASGKPRHRCRSARPHGLAGDRPAAADRAGAGAVLGRPHHHPRRADLGPVAARSAAPVRGAARRPRQRAQHRVHLALSRRRAGHRRQGDDLPQRPAHRHRRRRQDRQGLGDRTHDRQRPRRPGRELYRRDRARQQAPGAGHPRGARARGRTGLRRHFARCQGGRGAGRLRLHGLRPDRAGPRAVRQAEGDRGDIDQRRQGPAPAQHRRCAPRRRRLRSRKPPLDAVLPGAGLQEHVDQRAGPHCAAVAEARHRARTSRAAMSRRCRSVRRRWRRCCRACRAATSRRWRWPSG